MAIRIIVKDPDPILHEIAKAVPKITPNIIKLLDDMADTMYDAGGVGIAAPQVGIQKRVILVDPHDGETELLEVINPAIVQSDGEQLGAEGCLSIPGLNGDVNRKLNVTVIGWDREGKDIMIEATGYLARIFQHEIDHLNGILFTDIAEAVYKIPPDEPGE